MSNLTHPLATVHQNPNQVITDAMGRTVPREDDPAWQPPTDPALSKTLKESARVIHREIPLVTTCTGWSILQVRQAIENLSTGLFDMPAQLVDSVSGDSRVHSAFAQRIGGLLGREIIHKIPSRYKDSSLAKECYETWCEHWPQMATEAVLSDMSRWGCSLGFWLGQQLWDTSGDYWLPYIYPWHARYSYYHWIFRRYVAITLDGQVPISPGDGHWILHAPNGQYRGWMYGAIRAVAPWWLARNYALRDWARYSERHGMPIGKAITPFGADPLMAKQFRGDLGNLGQETILQLPQSPAEDIGKYDFEWCETTDQSWDGFQGLIGQCNAEITLAILGQNLTSEIKEGSLAAARVHADVRQSILEADARSLAATIYSQVARPFAAINFGNPDLAPRTFWDIIPYEDNKTQADTFYQFAIAVKALHDAGWAVTAIGDIARRVGIRILDSEIKAILSERSAIRQYHIQNQAVTRDEVRHSIGLPPAVKDGDEYLGGTAQQGAAAGPSAKKVKAADGKDQIQSPAQISGSSSKRSRNLLRQARSRA